MLVAVVASLLLLAAAAFPNLQKALGESDNKQQASDSLACVFQRAVQSGNPEGCESPTKDEDQDSYDEVVPESQ